jgi:hypothetical protein
MVEPSRLAAQLLFGCSQRAQDELPAGQRPHEVGSPILIRGKSTEKEINRPQVLDGRLRLKQIFQLLGGVEVEREDVLGAVLERKPQLTGTGILVVC